MKMKTCKKCKFKNQVAVSYCQRCGTKLSDKFSLRAAIEGDGGISIAGMGTRHMSMGPLGVEAARNEGLREFQDHQVKKFIKSHVDPLTDGSWYCPDCGYHNANKDSTCKSCFRDM